MAITAKLAVASLFTGMMFLGGGATNAPPPFEPRIRYADLRSLQRTGPMSVNPALAGGQCDENCSGCLLHNPWGGCIAEGNDPLCEARKAACQANNAVPGGQILNAPVQAGPTVINQCLQNLGSCPQAVIDQVPPAQLTMTCLRDVARCPQTVVNSIPTLALQPIVQQYLLSLRNQATGRWRTLPTSFINRFAPDYPDASLLDVRYATGINTMHGQAITIGDDIFFPGSIELTRRSDLQLMLHEVEHTAQYRRKGGIEPFLAEYILHAHGAILTHRSLNIHDEIAVERDAIAKAAKEIAAFGLQVRLTNRCSRPVETFIYDYEGGGWKLRQYSMPANKAAVLDDAHMPIHTDRSIYWHSRTMDGGPLATWAGSTMLPINGRDYGFRVTTIGPQDERIEIATTC